MQKWYVEKKTLLELEPETFQFLDFYFDLTKVSNQSMIKLTEFLNLG